MRANRKTARRAVAVCMTVLVSTVAVALATASPAQADPGCQNGGVYILWVRGSDQKIGDGEAMAFQASIQNALNATGIGTHAWAELGNLDGNGVVNPSTEYPAVPAFGVFNGEYDSSVTIGVNELTSSLNRRYALGPYGYNCTGETVVIGGYSQGAEVVGAALAASGGHSFTPETRNHIGFVALYGDPKLDAWGCPRPQWVRGSVSCNSIGIRGNRVPYLPGDMVNRAASWCDQNDGICNYGAPVPGTHLYGYRNELIPQSAAEVANMARTKRCQLTGMGCSSWGGVGSGAAFVGGSVLYAGNEIGINQYLASPDGRFALLFQADRNVALYGGSALWWTGTGGSNATRLAMQTDGNLVLYNGTTPVWSTRTSGSGANRLVVQSDGNLVLYTSSDTPVWSTVTGGHTSPIPRGGYLLGEGQQMDLNQYLQSPDHRITLLLQPDGNLVLYGPGYHVLWQSATSGQGVTRAVMQSDGNFVLYRANNTSVGQTGSSNSGANRIVVQNDGNLVVYRPNNTWVWQSSTGGQI